VGRTYVLSGHALADNLCVFVDKDVGFGSCLVDSSLGEGEEAGRCGALGFTVLEGLG
jgi:hypothetical protein